MILKTWFSYLFSRPGALALVLLVAASLPGLLAAGGEPRSPGSTATPAPAAAALARIGWHSIELGASSLLGSAVSRLRLYPTSGPDPAATDTTDPYSDEAVLVLLADSRVGGNRERRSAWFAPAGRLIERCRVGYGRSDSRAKCYRYAGRTVERERRESRVTAADIEARPDWTRDGARSALALARDWPVSSRGTLQLPPDIPHDRGLVSPTLLLPLASAAPLQTPGDSHVLYVHTDHDFYRVQLQVTGRETLETDYRLESATGERRIRQPIAALVIQLQITPLGDPEDGFELLGLRPPLRLLLDPDTRLPLALRGDAPRLGPGEVRLQAARLSE